MEPPKMTTAAEKIATTDEKPAATKRPALGRGLDSLLPGGPRIVPGATAPAAPPPAPATQTAPVQHATPVDGVVQLNLDLIAENPYQTRRQFDEAALAELAESIKATGVVQPVVVRPGADGRYVLILGERRCRASRIAGKDAVPAIIRRVSDEHEIGRASCRER